MKKITTLCCLVVSVAAFSETAPTAPRAPMDMGKLGPASRKPTDEKKIKDEIVAFCKKGEQVETASNIDLMASMFDFPIYMVTDDAKDQVEAKLWSREDFVAAMKPMMDAMPKDAKVSHKPTITVLSDALASVTDEYTQNSPSNKTKFTAKTSGLLVKVNGMWKWKVQSQAGWGGTSMKAEAPAANSVPGQKTAAAPTPATNQSPPPKK